MYFWTAASFVLLACAARASAATQNFTVDDTYGDSSGFSILEYVPQDPSWWNNGMSCDGCAVKPDVSGCVDESFHGATVGINATPRGYNLTFYGMKSRGFR